MKHTLHNLLGFAPQIVWGGGNSGGGGGGGNDDKPKRSAGKGTAPTVKSTASSLATDIKMGLSTFGQSKEKQAQTLRDQGYSEKAISSYQERTEASKARAATTQRDDDDRPAPKPAPEPEPTPEPEPEPEPTPEVDTVLPPEVDEPLTEVEEIAEVTFPTEEETTALEEATGEEAAELQTQYEPEAVKEDISPEKPTNVTTISTGTAAGGKAEAAAARPTSVGKAEDKAIDFYEKGRRSTILTTPRGLIGSGEEEGKTRRRRSLIG